jgi:hypothetical protein
VSEADRFKSRAEQCRRLAAQADNDGAKNAWLRLAAEWDKLPDDATERRGIFDRYD